MASRQHPGLALVQVDIEKLGHILCGRKSWKVLRPWSVHVGVYERKREGARKKEGADVLEP